MREKKKNKKKKKRSIFERVSIKKEKKRFPEPMDKIAKAGDDVRVVSTLPSSTPTTANTSAKMPNSIAFSSDMTKLYLIDCERNICFDLVNTNGVMVSTIKGQIFAVSAAKKRSTKVSSKTKRLRLSTKNAQYTLMYNEDKVQLFVIGFDDIDSSISDDKPADPVGENFEIKDHVVIIRRVGNDLELDYSKR
ncbi:MAG: hypothetical protein AB8G22_18615 [Saprospiraceae bacterium]